MTQRSQEWSDNKSTSTAEWPASPGRSDAFTQCPLSYAWLQGSESDFSSTSSLFLSINRYTVLLCRSSNLSHYQMSASGSGQDGPRSVVVIAEEGRYVILRDGTVYTRNRCKRVHHSQSTTASHATAPTSRTTRRALCKYSGCRDISSDQSKVLESQAQSGNANCSEWADSPLRISG